MLLYLQSGMDPIVSH